MGMPSAEYKEHSVLTHAAELMKVRASGGTKRPSLARRPRTKRDHLGAWETARIKGHSSAVKRNPMRLKACLSVRLRLLEGRVGMRSGATASSIESLWHPRHHILLLPSENKPPMAAFDPPWVARRVRFRVWCPARKRSRDGIGWSPNRSWVTG
jgi:hypothetical protein